MKEVETNEEHIAVDVEAQAENGPNDIEDSSDLLAHTLPEVPVPVNNNKREVSFDLTKKTSDFDTECDTELLYPSNGNMANETSSDEDNRGRRDALMPMNRRESVRRSLASIKADIFESIRQLELEEEKPKGNDYIWSWSRERRRLTAYACISSSAVLIIRLLLDHEPLAYLIHSIIVFLDMVLIHLFTNSLWLSVSGEVVTVIFFLAFHFTKETIWELLETTLIAVLCSFHLIASRKKAKEKNEGLEENMNRLRFHTLEIIENPEELAFLRQEHEEGRDEELREIVPESMRTVFVPIKDPVCKERLITCGSHFFEYFLDGSAGVMVSQTPTIPFSS